MLSFCSIKVANFFFFKPSGFCFFSTSGIKLLLCSAIAEIGEVSRSDGGVVCSFFSAARRTNQEAPPLLSGLFARSLLPPSGAAELASLRQSSPCFLRRQAPSRPDKGGFPCRTRLPLFSLTPLLGAAEPWCFPYAGNLLRPTLVLDIIKKIQPGFVENGIGRMLDPIAQNDDAALPG